MSIKIKILLAICNCEIFAKKLLMTKKESLSSLKKNYLICKNFKILLKLIDYMKSRLIFK